MLQLGLSGTPQVRRHWGGVPRVLGAVGGMGDPPVPWGGIASLWIRQDLVDGSVSTERAPASSPGRGETVPQSRTRPGCPGGAPAPRVHPCSGVVWCQACWLGCPGVLGEMMLEKLGSAAEQGGRHQATPRWRGMGHPPHPSIPLPQLLAHLTPVPAVSPSPWLSRRLLWPRRRTWPTSLMATAGCKGTWKPPSSSSPGEVSALEGTDPTTVLTPVRPPRALLRSLHGHSITRGFRVTPAETHQTHCTCGRGIWAGGGTAPIRLRWGWLGIDCPPSSPQSGRRGSACRRSRPRE